MNPLNQRPLVYLISDRRAFLRNREGGERDAIRSQVEAIERASSAGCQLIQIREKDLSPRRLLELTRMAIDASRYYRARVMINDRLDVALAARAGGVHLRVDSLPAGDVRRAIEARGMEDFLIAVSTHSLDEARAAESAGADFVVCGPLYDTPSKRGFGPPLGIDRFEQICSSVRIPVLALGGINLENFREPLLAGASGIAGISLFTDLETIESTVRTLKAP